MKKVMFAFAAIVSLQSCQPENEAGEIDPVNWNRRTVTHLQPDSMKAGTTYLSVYSEIYSENEHRKHPLASTISLRNVNRNDTIYISKAEFFNTSGELIRTYFDKPIFIAPMETVEIVIDQKDLLGGTGGNFLFDWLLNPQTNNNPLFDCVMISTYGQQGLSFTTTGYQVH